MLWIFAIVFLLLLGSVWGYLWISLLPPFHLTSISLTFWAAVWIVTFSLQLIRWLIYSREDAHPTILYYTYFSLGLVSHLALYCMAKDLFFWAVDFGADNDKIEAYLNLIAAGFCLGLNWWGTQTAMAGPIVRQVDLLIPYWPKDKEMKMVQISDLHVGPAIKKPYVEKVIAQIKNLQPDLMVVTGDFVDGSVENLQEDVEPFRKLARDIPVFFVTGNHEYYWKASEWTDKVSDLGFQVLSNQGNLFHFQGLPLWVGGVEDLSSHHFDKEKKSDPFKALDLEKAKNAYKVLLAHQPKSCFQAKNAGFDLLVCGHTHWGQFFPFTMLVDFFNPYSRALNDHEGMKVYVNAGTGFWGPPLRLGAHSEIALFNLKGNG